MRLPLTRSIWVLLVAMTALTCGLFAVSTESFIAVVPEFRQPAHGWTAVAAACVVAGVTVALLSGSRIAYYLACVLTSLALVPTTAFFVFPTYPVQVLSDSSFLPPPPEPVLGVFRMLTTVGSFLVTSGAVVGLVTLLLPATRRDLRHRREGQRQENSGS